MLQLMHIRWVTGHFWRKAGEKHGKTMVSSLLGRFFLVSNRTIFFFFWVFLWVLHIGRGQASWAWAWPSGFYSW